MRKGIHLYSGGLDSLLAAKLLMDQGIELVGLHFVLPFAPLDADPDASDESRRAANIGLKLRHERCGMDYIKMAANPPHGFGSNMNPCIDCKIFFMRRAAQIMKEEGASFVSTGEVLGQRPMSQTKDMLNHIKKETELDGFLLRPLSALLLKPTIAEDEGIVDRSKLLDISGRGRSRQMALAAEWGITDYAAPAGGCLYTDPNVARRIKDLYRYHSDFCERDLYLLSFGRHFRLNEKARMIVSRNEHETNELEKYAPHADLFLRPDFTGPCIYVAGDVSGVDVNFLVSVLARYGTPGKHGTEKVFVSGRDGFTEERSAGAPADDAVLEAMRI
jgi:tRNA U34 2-thiouridine synthase MnmA/TrmU